MERFEPGDQIEVTRENYDKYRNYLGSWPFPVYEIQEDGSAIVVDENGNGYFKLDHHVRNVDDWGPWWTVKENKIKRFNELLDKYYGTEI